MSRIVSPTSDGNIQKMGSKHVVNNEPEIRRCVRCGDEFETKDNFDSCEDCLRGKQGYHI